MIILVAEIFFGRAEKGILVMEYGYNDFQNPPCMASRRLLITRLAAAGTSFSPYRAKFGTTTWLPMPTAWKYR
jgi:hypothetical protein